VRLKKDIPFVLIQRPLSPRMSRRGYVKIQIGFLGVQDGCKIQGPDQLMRLVCVWDEKTADGATVDHLLDVDAWIIGYLYRCRSDRISPT